MSVKDVTVTEAHALQQQGHTYVDVRSTIEFAQGHPTGAVNVPLLEPDEETGQMQPNPDFVRVMQQAFPVDAPLLIGCQAGGRSLRAAQMLSTFGYTEVANVRGGFMGGSGGMGGRPADPGWAPSGLPTETEADRGESYRALLAKADAT